MRDWLCGFLVACISGGTVLANQDAVPAAAETPPNRPAIALADPIKLPTEITARQEIYVQVQINSSEPMSFLVDSAAGFPWIIDTKRASILGPRWRKTVSATGVGESTFEVAIATGATVSLGNLELTEQTIGITSLKGLQRYASRRLDGIVGYELFSSFVVEIEYETGLITLHDKRSFIYSGPGQIVPVEFENRHWYTNARVILDSGEPLDGRFLVDTGAGQIAAAFTRPFVEAHRLLQVPRGNVRMRIHQGLGGVTQSFVGNARLVQIGRAEMNNVDIDLSRDATGLLASSNYDGVIGGALLRGFKIIFDVSRKQMVFESNRANL